MDILIASTFIFKNLQSTENIHPFLPVNISSVRTFIRVTYFLNPFIMASARHKNPLVIIKQFFFWHCDGHYGQAKFFSIPNKVCIRSEERRVGKEMKSRWQPV